MKDLFFCIGYLYYGCSNIVLNGGYLEFELGTIVDDEEEFGEVHSQFYKEEDFEIEYCGESFTMPTKNSVMFYTKAKEDLAVWITFRYDRIEYE